MNRLDEMFNDKEIVKKIQTRLPHLFQIAAIECSRDGKVGMEVGSLRERILICLLIHKFGEDNVETKIPITEPETDVKLFGKPISIKTITGWGGVKMIWTVDAKKAKEFLDNYRPKCDILLIQIDWGKSGGFYFIPIETQRRVFKQLGKERYIKLPKGGTNPRGVEISKEALLKLAIDEGTKKIKIDWLRTSLKYSAYDKWLDYWNSEDSTFGCIDLQKKLE